MFPSQCEMILSLCTSCLCCCLTMADQKHPDSNQSQQITKALLTRSGPVESPLCWHWRLQPSYLCCLSIWSSFSQIIHSYITYLINKKGHNSEKTYFNVCTDTSSYLDCQWWHIKPTPKQPYCCSRCTGPSSYSRNLEIYLVCWGNMVVCV